MYTELFKDSGLTYADVAHELGCCEQTARRKIKGEASIKKGEQIILDTLFNKNKSEEATSVCSTLRRNR